MSNEPEVTGVGPKRPAAVVRETVADREVRNPFYRYLVHLGLPVSFSIAIHVFVIGFLALKTFDVITRRPIEVGEYEASLTESADDQMDSAFQWRDEAEMETPDEAPLEDALDSLTSFQDMSDVDLSDLTGSDAGEGTGDGVGAGSGLGIGDGTLSLLGTGSGAGEAGSGGFGSGLGGGGARIGRAGIWNLTIRANKIAYVVDFSGSILVAKDDLKRELKRSVGRLKPSQSFNVIIFYEEYDKVKTDSFKSKLEPAIEDIRREFFQWIDRKAPKGGTEPLQAMKRAIALSPEAIFFFSDGYFDDSVVAEITRANRGARARIYCLVFDEVLLEDTSGLPRETEGARRLKQVAEANNGQVKVVTGADLAR